MTAQEAVVKKITTLCMEKDITFHRLAYLSAVPYSTVKSILYKKSTNTGIETISKLCGGLEISITDFFSGEIFDVIE